MKIAFTADNHLARKEDYPFRYITLGKILEQCGCLGVDLLVIAGDLFDKNYPNYSEFEAVCHNHRPSNLKIVVIPGNHDHLLSQEKIVVSELEIISEPKVIPLDGGYNAIFLPYQDGITMGEMLSTVEIETSAAHKILIGHGDWTEGLWNPLEQGGYMPLTQFDVLQNNFDKVFLGHIHLPYDGRLVHYPGSPCPLDITETGLRRILLFDTETGKVEPHTVDSPIIFYNERFISLPDEKGIDRLKQEMLERIDCWDCPDDWMDRIHVRVVVNGYTDNRRGVLEAAQGIFNSYRFYDHEGVILTDLHQVQDLDRAYLSEKMQTWIDNLNWPSDPLQPTKDDILLKSLSKIYEI